MEADDDMEAGDEEVFSYEPGEPGIAPFKEGATYKSYKDLQCALEAYMVKTSTVYVHASGVKAAHHNSTLTPKGFKVAEELEYFKLVLHCKHFGDKKKNKKLTGQRPNQSTFKMMCLSKININATIEGVLIIKSFNEEHTNHPQDPALFPMYPERRHLDKDEEAKVSEMLTAKAKAMLIQASLSKFTTPQDIANVRTRMRLGEEKKFESDTQHLFAILEEINKTPGSVVIIGEEATEVEVSGESPEEGQQEENRKKKILFVFFQTAEMAKNFHDYPEVVGMDTTYCVNRNNMPLVVFRVTDRHGQGKPAGYCLVSNEKLDIMRESVMAFKAATSDHIEQVQTIVVDKDYNEVTVLKEVLPWVHIHLCSVHVLENFKRATKDEPTKDKIREVLQNMVYALTKARYQECLTELEMKATEAFMKYFNDNWAEYGASWSCYQRLNSLNLGQRTNNSVESHNQKIKSLVNKRSTLAELVKGLLVLQVSGDAVTNYKDFLGITKVSYRTDTKDPIIKKILGSATPFAAECIRVEYEEGLRRVKLPTSINFKNWKPTIEKCPCPIFKERLLPCRHMFVLRQFKGVEVFSPEVDVPARWQKVRAEEFRERVEELPTSYIPEGFLSTKVLKKGGKCLNQNQRFKESSKLAQEAAQVIALSGGKQYTNKMKSLDQIINIWRKGKDVVVLEAGETANGLLVEISNDCDKTDDPVEPAQNDNLDGDKSTENSVENIPSNSSHKKSAGGVVSHVEESNSRHQNDSDHDDGRIATEELDLFHSQREHEHDGAINETNGNSNESQLDVQSQGEVNSGNTTHRSPPILHQVPRGFQSKKYTSLSKENKSNMVVPERLKIRGRPKGGVLTKIGLKKKNKDKVPCMVCHELGWWKDSQVTVNGDTQTMILCPSCLDFSEEVLQDEDEVIEEFSSEDENCLNSSNVSANDPGGFQEKDTDAVSEIICISSDDEEFVPNRVSLTEVKKEIETDEVPSEQLTTSKPNAVLTMFTSSSKSSALFNASNSTSLLDISNSTSVLNKSSTTACTSKSTAYIPVCDCGNPCERRTCKKLGPNLGREMFRCPIQCSKKMFRWVDTLFNVDGSRRDPQRTPSKDKSKFPFSSLSKTPCKTIGKSPLKTTKPALNNVSIVATTTPKTVCNGPGALCSCGVAAVKRKVYFGEHAGGTVSICGKDPVCCKYKVYSEKTAATPKPIPTHDERNNVTLRRKIADQPAADAKRPKRDAQMPSRIRTSYVFETP